MKHDEVGERDTGGEDDGHSNSVPLPITSYDTTKAKAKRGIQHYKFTAKLPGKAPHVSQIR